MRNWWQRDRKAVTEGALCAAIVLASMALSIWG